MPSLLESVKSLFSKLHFIASLAMFFFIALIVVDNDVATRAFLLLPVVVCFVLSKLLFAMDQANMTKAMMADYRHALEKRK